MTAGQAFPGGHYLATQQAKFHPVPSTPDDAALSQAAGAVVSPATAPLLECARMDTDTLLYLHKLLAA